MNPFFLFLNISWPVTFEPTNDLFVLWGSDFADTGQDDITGSAVDGVAGVHVARGDYLPEVDWDDVGVGTAMTLTLLGRISCFLSKCCRICNMFLWKIYIKKH